MALMRKRIRRGFIGDALRFTLVILVLSRVNVLSILRVNDVGFS